MDCTAAKCHIQLILSIPEAWLFINNLNLLLYRQQFTSWQVPCMDCPTVYGLAFPAPHKHKPFVITLWQQYSFHGFWHYYFFHQLTAQHSQPYFPIQALHGQWIIHSESVERSQFNHPFKLEVAIRDECLLLAAEEMQQIALEKQALGSGFQIQRSYWLQRFQAVDCYLQLCAGQAEMRSRPIEAELQTILRDGLELLENFEGVIHQTHSTIPICGEHMLITPINIDLHNGLLMVIPLHGHFALPHIEPPEDSRPKPHHKLHGIIEHSQGGHNIVINQKLVFLHKVIVEDPPKPDCVVFGNCHETLALSVILQIDYAVGVRTHHKLVFALAQKQFADGFVVVGQDKLVRVAHVQVLDPVLQGHLQAEGQGCSREDADCAVLVATDEGCFVQWFYYVQ